MAPTQQSAAEEEAQALREFKIKRLIVGILSLLCLVMAGVSYSMAPDSPGAFVAVCSRLGITLGAMWLALPELRPFFDKLPLIALAILLPAIWIVSARPNLFRVVGSLCVVIGALIGISKWIKRMTGKS